MMTLSNLAYERIIELIINNYFKYDVTYNANKLQEVHNTLRKFFSKIDAEHITTHIAKTVHKRVFFNTLNLIAYSANFFNIIKDYLEYIGSRLRGIYYINNNLQEYLQRSFIVTTSYKIVVRIGIYNDLKDKYNKETINELSKKLLTFLDKQVYTQHFRHIVLKDAIQATNIFNTTRQSNEGFISIKEVCSIVNNKTQSPPPSTH
ncbi:hypothetical protein [Candidatus Neoehrlichia procyonis]|uniref:Uncharacterized protein n=1 Tax=Candidatus Neoehrlichia procyonis str. RAC413 TaxID=1359163 RepID=A0A0F3NPF4_9RICK|nr:hypothetical protein [Candidatus Neoehrlichia lotoris]KJV68794.1 hypothetical protein NLO413_0159 [Candidatus Neoehrlichia lotoris str. RAC413]